MTVLGAALYAGFFGLAALWLLATGPDPADDRAYSQRQDRSNSTSAAAGPAGSSPC